MQTSNLSSIKKVGNVNCNMKNEVESTTCKTIHENFIVNEKHVPTICVFTERANIIFGDWTGGESFSFIAMDYACMSFSLYRDFSQWSWMLSSSWRKNRLGCSDNGCVYSGI